MRAGPERRVWARAAIIAVVALGGGCGHLSGLHWPWHHKPAAPPPPVHELDIGGAAGRGQLPAVLEAQHAGGGPVGRRQHGRDHAEAGRGHQLAGAHRPARHARQYRRARGACGAAGHPAGLHQRRQTHRPRARARGLYATDAGHTGELGSVDRRPLKRQSAPMRW